MRVLFPVAPPDTPLAHHAAYGNAAHFAAHRTATIRAADTLMHSGTAERPQGLRLPGCASVLPHITHYAAHRAAYLVAHCHGNCGLPISQSANCMCL